MTDSLRMEKLDFYPLINENSSKSIFADGKMYFD